MSQRDDKTPQQQTAISAHLYWHQSRGNWDFELTALNTRASVICAKPRCVSRAREYRKVLPVLMRGTTPVELKATGRRPVKHGA